MRTRPINGLFLAIAVVKPTFALAQELPQQSNRSSRANQQYEVFTGVDYQHGEYGTDAKVEVISTVVGISVRKGRVRLGAAVPYLRTIAPVDVVVSHGGLFGMPLLPSDANQTARTKRQGLGDSTFQVAYDLPVTGFDALLGAAVKLPTASRAKGIGTGKFDYVFNGQVTRSLGEGITPFADVGYTILGKPDEFDVRNTLSGTTGARMALSPRASAVVSYSYEQSASRSLGDRQSLGLGLGVALGQKLQLGIQDDAGLTRAAPDVKVGFRIGAGF